MNKLKLAYTFFLDRLGETSTWQGIGFLVALFTAKFNGLDWGACAALGGTLSAFIKTMTKG
jgi:NhaP-type Na+/H+ or K+/H+ antiporter